ncbi:uncharacterized protein FIESC28_05444 [Fusarium coffeatum]|uniref:LicD/FKTN/FKRP nucleotidyltransferase domain-containing protein n=1 Tax=Fusarium coffeatum TaxID=231269 RepID=A0A366RTC7_9HYPO|nr:uncharacterized protein FIESC28_05444 [Fusarium coffeatum]RBR19838.1 hypothetical protein FIESC28_05444 [Fusarium coffeatum]
MRSVKSLLLWSLASFSAPAAALPPLSGETRNFLETSSLSKRADDKPKPKTPKYFVEAGRNIELGHYDGRYFKWKIGYDEHRDVLRDLIRSYLFTMDSYGVETWIAHGTLLGWWWNGQIMPWDYDLDVQVSNSTLQWIGDNLNRTEHNWNYTETDTGKFISKRYLLDINPHHVDIDRADGRNIIDGRWIDMQNGMYVDITGLREREVSRPGIWSCKNKHRYKSQDLWPMRITEFEGVRARVPFNFNKILVDEYDTKSLVTESWAGHRWDHDNKIWIKENEEEATQRKLDAADRHLAADKPEEATSEPST